MEGISKMTAYLSDCKTVLKVILLEQAVIIGLLTGLVSQLSK